MHSDRSAELIAHARELEHQDAEIAARIDDAAGLSRRVDDVRARAERVRLALAALPEEIDRVEQGTYEAQARAVEASREMLDAERRLQDLQNSRRATEDAKTAAERALRRASVLATDAVGAVSWHEERLRVLESDHVALGAEADGLAVEARTVAREVVELPRLSESGRTTPGSSLAEIEEWGARAHSAIFVVRGGLEAERERLVHEASTLAAAALGEQVAGASVSLLRRRLEEKLGST